MSQTKAELIEPQGNVAFDTNTLYVDAGNNRVGIGTTSPAVPLEVSGSSAQVRVIDSAVDFRILPLAASNAALIGCQSNHDLVLRTNASERVRIDTSGRLLVGTPSDTSGGNGNALLQVVSSGPGRILPGRSDGSTAADLAIGAVDFRSFAGSAWESVATITAFSDGVSGSGDKPGRLVFSTTADGASSPTERLRITNQGWTQLVSASDGYLAATTAAAGTSTEVFRGTYGATAGSQNTGTISIRIYNNGNVQNTNNSYGALSDIKLKENIVDANSQWNDLKAFQVRNYNFKEGQTHTQIGLIAQEVELVSPGLVTESPDRDAEGNDLGTVTKSVNYSVLYMKAVKALQEAMERIETLEAKVAALESA